MGISLDPKSGELVLLAALTLHWLAGAQRFRTCHWEKQH